MKQTRNTNLILTLFVIISSLLIASSSFAISVSISLDRTEATIVDLVKLSISVEGSQNVGNPILYNVSDFHVQSGGRSSRFNMVNGQVSTGTEQVVYLRAKKEGKFTIGPAEISVDGQKYQSNTVELTVQKDPVADTQAENQSSQIFMTASISPESGYPGQEFFYTVKFFTTLPVRDLAIDVPNSENFTFKQIEEPLKYESVVNGKRYSVIEIRNSAYANKPGQYTIAPTKMNMQIIEPQQNPFDGFFNDPFFSQPFSSSRPHSVESNSINFNLKPTPDENRPNDFVGLIGQFSMKSSLNPQKLPAGESTTLSITLEGIGNVRAIPDLKIPEIAGIKIYADQPVLDIQTTKTGTKGIKTMKWALVPQKQGVQTIPKISLSYFNPKTEKYEQLQAGPFNLEVSEGQQQNIAVENPTSTEQVKPIKKEIEILKRDILPIHDIASALEPDIFNRMKTWQVWILVIFPVSVFLILSFVTRYKTSQNKEIILSKRASSKFYQQIQASKDISEILKSINVYLNERMKLGGGNLTPEEVYKILLKRGIPEAVATEMKLMLVKFESHVYAGLGADDIQDVKNSIKGVINKIDKKIR